MKMEEAEIGRSDHGAEDKEERTAKEEGEEIGFKLELAVKQKVMDESQVSSHGKSSSSCEEQTGSSPVKDDNDSMVFVSDPIGSSQIKQTDELEHAKAEMGQVREENERLKLYLEQITKDYKVLQMQLRDTNKEDEPKNESSEAFINGKENQIDESESEIAWLSLGRYSSSEPKKDKAKATSHERKVENDKEGLSLALDCNFENPKDELHGGEPAPRSTSPVNSSEDTHEDTWQVSKGVKRPQNTEDAEASQQNVPSKKVRVSVRARCDTPTMNDGCQWRKYGQKIAKGNPCPRAYYRCTVAPQCPVRKQVQRCAEDMSILITTYEGTHNHPLPMSATAMASTTSAAASMILSGSSTSASHGGQSQQSLPATNMAADLYGLNLYLSSPDSSKIKQFYVHNSSLSSSPSYPTITLDLAPGAPSNSMNPYSRFPSTYSHVPKFAISNGLGLGSSSEGNSALQWGNGVLNYGSSTTGLSSSSPLTFGRNYQVGSPLTIGRPIMESNGVQLQHQNKNMNHLQQFQGISDPVAAATKAITTDPNFQSALVAALTSIISNGTNSGNGVANQAGLVESLAQKFKWGEQHSAVTGNSNSSIFQVPVKTNGCPSGYLNRTASSSAQVDSIVFMPPSLSFSSPGSASSSPAEKKDHIS